MKGLILNNIYSVGSNLKIYVALVIITGGLTLWDGTAMIMELHLALSLLSVPVGSMIICIQKCNSSKWNRMEIVFPLARKTIVLAQYSTYLLFLLLGLMLSVPFIILSGDYSNLLTFLAVSILTSGFFFPLTYKFSDDKLFIIMMGSLVFSFAILTALEKILEDFDFTIVLAQLIALVCSYLISVRIYSKKDM